MLVLTLALTVTLGISQTLLGPGQLPDSPVVTLGDYHYLANGPTYRFDANWQQLGVALEGTPGSFDECGAWLQAVYQDSLAYEVARRGHPPWGDGLNIRAWYHAEEGCNYANNLTTKKSMAYAESYDGGLTFTKLGQIITAPPYIPDSRYDDEGDFTVITNGDFFYLYFLTTRDGRVHLARSLIASGGGPGTWVKWYGGGFTEPGLGGESDPIAWQWDLLAPWSPRWNGYLGRYIGLARRREGWALSLSEDGINWTGTDCLLLENAGSQWQGRDTAPLPLMSYVHFWGDGQTVDLYFLYIPAYQGFNSRYLMRRRVMFEGLPGGCATGPAVEDWLPVVGK